MATRSSHRRSRDMNTETVIEEHVVRSNGDVTIRRYNKGKFLGKGGFARVYEMTAENRKVYAAKVVPKDSLTKSRAKQKLMSEIRIHRALKHPNIVKFEHFFEDADNVYILLELCPNQSLNELVRRRKRLTELEVQCYMLQCISALKDMHSHKVIHRDMKLGNLFLSEKLEIKVGDFGLAAKLEYDGQKRKTICGTPNYIAPEVLDGKVGHSYEVDIWSLGVILYTLLVGKPPFETSDVKTTYNRIRMNAYSFPEHIKLSEEAVSLVTQILRSDPKRRPTLDDILEHEFFHMGYSIPKLLPVSTLAVPPSETYLKQFIGNTMQPVERATADTVPVSLRPTGPKPQRDLINTQRPKSRMSLGRTDSKNSGHMSPRSDNSSQQQMNEVWVKKWVDYSSKYGVGYLLSNGAAGVFFNDSSKILLEPGSGQVYYMERNAEKQDVVSCYSLYGYPKEIHKKITLLQHFRSYLEVQQETMNSYDASKYSPQNPPPYVKKWMRTRRAILFRLTNKIVQVSFQDHTEVILSSETRMVTYVNKRGERNTLPLTSAMESSNQEMSKRLRYTKEILNFMLNGQGHTGGTGSPPASRRKVQTQRE